MNMGVSVFGFLFTRCLLHAGGVFDPRLWERCGGKHANLISSRAYPTFGRGARSEKNLCLLYWGILQYIAAVLTGRGIYD